MTSKENASFKNLTITYKPRLVQITCNQNLKSYLNAKGNGSLKLADHILEEYQTQQHTVLKIDRDSLAIEILAHTYADSFSQAVTSMDKLLPLPLRQAMDQLMDYIHRHTEIIDCGEAEADSNRWIWDKLTPYKAFIYGVLSDRA